MTTHDTETLSAIREATVQDIADALGVRSQGVFSWVTRQVAGLISQRFVHDAAAFDQKVGADNLQSASLEFAEKLGVRLELKGMNNIPDQGPVLLVANHPGLSDTLALFAGIQRLDVRILAESNPFLLALPNVWKQLFLLPKDGGQRGLTIRPMYRHLKAGGAVLTFPAGSIEPDPSLHREEAIKALANWSESVELLGNHVHNLAVIPIVVSGVLNTEAQRHWFTHVRKGRKDRERVGAFLQLVFKRFQRVTVTVRAGDPLVASPHLMQQLRDEMAQLMR